jgi:hypothetical protein
MRNVATSNNLKLPDLPIKIESDEKKKSFIIGFSFGVFPACLFRIAAKERFHDAVYH